MTGMELASIQTQRPREQERNVSKLLQHLKLLMLLGLLGGAGFAVSACEEGAFEDAGEEIDDAADEVGDELE